MVISIVGITVVGRPTSCLAVGNAVMASMACGIRLCSGIASGVIVPCAVSGGVCFGSSCAFPACFRAWRSLWRVIGWPDII